MTPDEKHIKRINKYLLSINSIYDDLVREIALIAVKLKVSDKLFRFKDYHRITKQVNDSLQSYQDRLISSIKVYSEYEWDYGLAKVDDELKGQLVKVKGKVIPEAYDTKMREISKQSQNKKAFEAFQERKVGKFTTSERVWKIGAQARENLEFALDAGLKEGISAQELERSIKSNLNNPDALFRKVRDKHGNLQLSKNAQSFHPGQGVYRSAQKNALRLASNEINTNYRQAEQTRILQNNDVVGVQINLSPSHKVYDMCDELKGTYPKDFNWSSWHVQCKCFRTTILKSESEFINELNSNQNLPPESSKNFVADVPDNFSKWVGDYEGNKTPYFISENKKFVKSKQDQSIDILIKNAKDSNPEVQKLIDNAISKYGGYSTPMNFKSRDSILRKVTTELNGDVSAVKDSIRATVILPIKDYKEFAEKLEKSGIFDRVKYQSPDKFSGYQGIITNIKTKNGTYGEVQFNTEKMIFAKEKPDDAIRIIGKNRWNEIQKESGLSGGLGHSYYEKMRVLDKSKPSELALWDKLNIESNNYYKNFR